MACVLFFLVLAGRDTLVSLSLGSGAIAFLSAAAGMRCPRCRLGIDSREHGGYAVGYVPDARCPRCGRDRRGVWPFQFLFRPERREVR
ncbi:MAG: hypothetical protein EON86_04410 [Brevundimonas sp.]|nr:MAG: hypothetical protein EON86_04410 [Brevundimonas sp.]